MKPPIEPASSQQSHTEDTLNTVQDLRQMVMAQVREQFLQKAQQVNLSNPHNVTLFQNALADLQAAHDQTEATLLKRITSPDPEITPSTIIEGQVHRVENPNTEELTLGADYPVPPTRGDDHELQ